MNQTQETMSFSRLRKPLEYALVAGLLVILAGFAVWAVVRQGDILLSILITAAFLVPVGLLVAIALLRVKISSQGISLSLCGITLKKIKASDIHTITLTETSIRYGTLVALAVFSIPAEEMEKAKELDLPISLHEEDPLFVGAPGVHQGKVSVQLHYKGASRTAEDIMVARDCMLALHTKAPVCIQHIREEKY